MKMTRPTTPTSTPVAVSGSSSGYSARICASVWVRSTENRVRLLPLREDPFTLLAPDTELLGGVVDWLGFYITHGVQDYWAVSTAFVCW